jgi:cell division initiation protein
MAFTPVEIRHVRHPRGLLGYRRQPVDRLLTEIADSFEQVWRDRADLADKVEQLETDISRYKELEQLLRATLVSAERTSHELRDAAKRESETIVGEAQAEARVITREARVQREQLLREARRIRLLLSSALDSIDEYELLAEEPEPVAQDAEAA